MEDGRPRVPLESDYEMSSGRAASPLGMVKLLPASRIGRCRSRARCTLRSQSATKARCQTGWRASIPCSMPPSNARMSRPAHEPSMGRCTARARSCSREASSIALAKHRRPGTASGATAAAAAEQSPNRVQRVNAKDNNSSGMAQRVAIAGLRGLVVSRTVATGRLTGGRPRQPRGNKLSYNIIDLKINN